MHQSPIYYVSVKNGPVPQRVTSQLIYEAAIMLRDRVKQRIVHGDGFDAVITTKFEIAILGHLSGIAYKATIEREEGELRLHFMVRERELQRIADDLLDPFADPDVRVPVSKKELAQCARALDYPMLGTYN